MNPEDYQRFVDLMLPTISRWHEGRECWLDTEEHEAWVVDFCNRFCVEIIRP